MPFFLIFTTLVMSCLPRSRLSGVLFSQAGLDPASQDVSCDGTTSHQAKKRDAREINGERSMSLQENLLPVLVIQKNGLQL